MERSGLEELAWAAIDVPELARGVCGSVMVEGLEKVRAAQLLFLLTGWERNERREGVTKLEHRIYERRFGDELRIATITAGSLYGVFAEIEVKKEYQ